MHFHGLDSNHVYFKYWNINIIYMGALAKNINNNTQRISIFLIYIFLFVFPFSSAFAIVANKIIPITLIEKSLIYLTCLLVISTGILNKAMFRSLILIGLALFIVLLQLLIYPHNFEISLNAFLRLTFPVLFYSAISTYIGYSGTDLSGRIGVCLFGLAFLSVLSILSGYVTGLGGEIGGRGESISGNKGFFIGANEVGILFLLILIVIGRLNSFILRITSFLAVLICGLIVLTKSSLVASLYSAYLLITRNEILRYPMVLFVLICLAYFFDSLSALFFEVTAGTFLDSTNQLFSQFLLRGRQFYFEAFFSNVNMDSLTNLIRFLFIGFGENYVADTIAEGIGIEAGRRSTFEMDILDLVFSMGVVFSVCYLVAVIYFLRSLFPYLFFAEKMIIFSVILHSILAGHVIYSPMITTTIVLVFFVVKNNPRIS